MAVLRDGEGSGSVGDVEVACGVWRRAGVHPCPVDALIGIRTSCNYLKERQASSPSESRHQRDSVPLLSVCQTGARYRGVAVPCLESSTNNLPLKKGDFFQPIQRERCIFPKEVQGLQTCSLQTKHGDI